MEIMKSVIALAMKDISEHLKDEYKDDNDYYIDFIVKSNHLNNPETTKLNQELGIHKINKK